MENSTITLAGLVAIITVATALVRLFGSYAKKGDLHEVKKELEKLERKHHEECKALETKLGSSLKAFEQKQDAILDKLNMALSRSEVTANTIQNLTNILERLAESLEKNETKIIEHEKEIALLKNNK